MITVSMPVKKKENVQLDTNNDMIDESRDYSYFTRFDTDGSDPVMELDDVEKYKDRKCFLRANDIKRNHYFFLKS